MERKSGKTWPLIVFSIVGGLAVSITSLVLQVHFHQQTRPMEQLIAAGPANLARERAAAEREGILLDPSKVQKPLPPSGLNAAPLYTKLTNLLRDKPLTLAKYGEGMDAFHTYTPEQIATVRKILADRQDVMILIHQAAEKPQCVFSRDWTEGADVTFPEYQRMRQAVRLIKTESYLLARDGHYQEAVTNQAYGFRVAHHADSDHVLISYLMGNANEAITFSGMQSILAIAGPNASVDAGVSKASAITESNLSLRQALKTEPAVWEGLFQDLHHQKNQGIAGLTASLDSLSSGKGIGPNSQAPLIPVSALEKKLVSDMIDVQHANYLADMVRIVAAEDMPEPIRRAEFAAVLDASAPSAKNGARTISFILMPDGLKLDDDERRIHAREAVTLAAAAILGVKAHSGAFPTKVPSGFIDPFTGKALLYRQEGDTGFVVYSAGPTGRFDGGSPGQTIPGAESLFRYPAVPQPLNL